MTDYFISNPLLLVVVATLFTWAMTSFGAAFVFVFNAYNRKVMDFMLGFAAGIMIAASFFSLLLPAIHMSGSSGTTKWIPAVVGFLAGGSFLFLIDKVIPHLHLFLPMNKSEGIRTKWHKSALLVMAITIHNIPEGLAVGVAFGALAGNMTTAGLAGAIALAVGIGIQDIPEGTAVSMPLRREGMSKLRSFWFGQMSGLVEAVSGIAGAIFVMFATSILPYALSFAAGAMIFVVVEELIPESQAGENTDIATAGTMVGFALMMLLDVALS